MNDARAIHWIVPAYNEQDSIVDLIDRIAETSRAAGWNWDLLIVDDGSCDETSRRASDHSRRLSLPVRILRHEQNRGLGCAMRTGLKTVARSCKPDDVLITLDADLTQDPIYAIDMVARLADGLDVVIASRYRRDSSVQGVPMLRRLLSTGANLLVSLVRPIRGVRDYSSGFRAYRASVIQRAFATFGDEFVSEEGFACMLEIAQRLRSFASFCEIPFVLRYHRKRKRSAIELIPTIRAYLRVIVRTAGTTPSSLAHPDLLLALTSVSLSAAAQVMLRAGARDLGGLPLYTVLAAALGRPVVLAGLSLYVVASVLWLGVLSRVPLSVAYPLGAIGFVLVVLAAALTGEPVPFTRWLGVLLVTAGILLVWSAGKNTIEGVSEP